MKKKQGKYAKAYFEPALVKPKESPMAIRAGHTSAAI
jgi:hypothetical protein